MKCINLPDQDILKEIFYYDSITGELVWKNNIKRPDLNGTVAGHLHKTGYRRVRVKSVMYQAHRIIWKLMYGYNPEEIDHIDQQRWNNKLSNLTSLLI